MKKKVRKKLSKYLAKLVKRHGAEMTLALVAGIVSSLANKASEPAKKRKALKTAKIAKKTTKPAVRTIVVRKRAAR